MLRWRLVATLALTLWTGPACVAALPAITAEHTDTHEATVNVDREAPAPVAEPDIDTLRSWMSHSLRPVLLDDEDIDPAEWPLLEFRPLMKGLELELDLPALLETQN